MRAELIVILVCLGLAVVCAVFCYCCLIVAGDADQKQEEAAKKMKKEKGLCVKNLYLPDGKGGFEEVKTVKPEDIETGIVVRPLDGLSASERTVLEKKAEEKHGNQD
jgi:hypothetical protein